MVSEFRFASPQAKRSREGQRQQIRTNRQTKREEKTERMTEKEEKLRQMLELEIQMVASSEKNIDNCENRR